MAAYSSGRFPLTELLNRIMQIVAKMALRVLANVVLDAER